MSTQVQITIPDFVDLTASEIRTILAEALYTQGRVSLGQAAAIVGLSKRAFLESLGAHGISVINYGPEELTSDFENA